MNRTQKTSRRPPIKSKKEKVSSRSFDQLNSMIYDLKRYVDLRWLSDLIFVTYITDIISGKKIVMWRNFSFPCMTIVGKLKISPHVEKFQYNWWGFIAIYAVLLLNLLFTLFCREIYFATIYALSCGEILSPKVHLWRKMTNIWSDNIPQHDDNHIISAHCSWVKVRVDSLPESILLPY